MYEYLPYIGGILYLTLGICIFFAFAEVKIITVNNDTNIDE